LAVVIRPIRFLWPVFSPEIREAHSRQNGKQFCSARLLWQAIFGTSPVTFVALERAINVKCIAESKCGTFLAVVPCTVVNAWRFLQAAKEYSAFRLWPLPKGRRANIARRSFGFSAVVKEINNLLVITR
jgi:hypothetical protein